MGDTPMPRLGRCAPLHPRLCNSVCAQTPKSNPLPHCGEGESPDVLAGREGRRINMRVRKRERLYKRAY